MPKSGVSSTSPIKQKFLFSCKGSSLVSMDIAVIWKECVLCEAHYKQDELKEHMTLWHAESSINE